jgi:hypothetical protein
MEKTIIELEEGHIILRAECCTLDLLPAWTLKIIKHINL